MNTEKVGQSSALMTEKESCIIREKEHFVEEESGAIAWIKGHGSPKTYGIYIMVLLIISLVFSLIAQSMFPVQYNILYHHVSQQGGLANNPDGHMFWNIMMIVTGVLYIPYVLHFYHSGKHISPTLFKFANMSAILACIGLSFVGVFPEDLGITHQIPASFAFFGFLIAADLYWLKLSKFIKSQELWRKILFHGVYTLINCSFLMILIQETLNFTPLRPETITPWLNFQVWEWFMAIGIFSWLYGLILLFPLDKLLHFEE